MDWPSPILVKELRQAMRNKLVITLLSVLLIAYLLVSGLLLAMARNGNLSALPLAGGNPARMGADFFNLLFLMFVVPVFLFIPFYVAGHLAWERRCGTLELISATRLTENQIVLGKVGSGVVLGLFYLSLITPFLMMSFLLRGIEVFAVLLILVMTGLMLCSAIYWTLFWTVLRAPTAMKWVFYGVALFGLLVLIGITGGFATGLQELGLGVFAEGLPWLIFVATFWLIGNLFAHAIAIDQIRTVRWEYQYLLEAENARRDLRESTAAAEGDETRP